MPISVCRRWLCVASLLALALPMFTPAWAQRTAPLTGIVSPNAVGPAAPTPVPIGGLRTQPLSFRTSDAVAPRRTGRFPVVVVDAPRTVPGVVTTAIDATVTRSEAMGSPWLPSAERPRWRVDPRVTPVQAWRDLIVTDMVCNVVGVCLERQQAIRARWINGCRCYAFADGWNRIWRVE